MATMIEPYTDFENARLTDFSDPANRRARVQPLPVDGHGLAARAVRDREVQDARARQVVEEVRALRRLHVPVVRGVHEAEVGARARVVPGGTVIGAVPQLHRLVGPRPRDPVELGLRRRGGRPQRPNSPPRRAEAGMVRVILLLTLVVGVLALREPVLVELVLGHLHRAGQGDRALRDDDDRERARRHVAMPEVPLGPRLPEANT